MYLLSYTGMRIAWDALPSRSFSRRSFVRGAGVLGAAGLAASYRPALGPARAAGATPLRHVIVACQENRSFDHYFGYYPRAGAYGVPAGYAQPDGRGGMVAPHHLVSDSTPDIAHEWPNIHAEWDSGRMDGFARTDGTLALGYYDARDLGYYYSLADQFTLCGNYFCSLLGPTTPNRLYLASGTSGGNTSNTVAQGSLRWPTILDLLDRAGISFKVYNGFGGIAAGLNPFTFFARWANDPRVTVSEDQYVTDLKQGTLPRFSFIVPNIFYCEHPPASITAGQGYIQGKIAALMHSSAWSSSAFILTYDEGGGFFDHVAPLRLDTFGPGFRVPTLVVSPYAKRGHIAPVIYDHGSVLKLVEAVFGLPTLASINHRFDRHTPGRNNEAARGAPIGPAAPPRDGRRETGTMLELFDFSQNPAYHPKLAHVAAVPSV